MEILYIKLKNGTDIISNTSIKGNNVTLEKPMAIRQYADTTGRVSLSFQEWVPSDFTLSEKFIISKDETLLICETTTKVKEFYQECLKPLNDIYEDTNESYEDSYSNIIKLLSNNRKLIH